MEVGNVGVFLEPCTIASACNKVFRKRLIPNGRYKGNRKFSKKALMWLLHKEGADKCKILHARNGREYRLPEVPHFSVDGFCAETRTVFQFMGCFFHGCKCQPFRSLKTLGEDTLAERYEQTMLRIEQIANAGYTVIVMWECFQNCRKETTPTNTPDCAQESTIHTGCPVRG